MADAIGQVLTLAVGVSLSPVPIIAVVLMLGTPAGRRNGPAFLAGWVLGLAVVATIVLLVAGGAGANDGGEPATWVDVLKLALGALLLLLAARQWRGGPARRRRGRTAQVDAEHRPLHGGPVARHRHRALRRQPEEPAADRRRRRRCRAGRGEHGRRGRGDGDLRPHRHAW